MDAGLAPRRRESSTARGVKFNELTANFIRVTVPARVDCGEDFGDESGRDRDSCEKLHSECGAGSGSCVLLSPDLIQRLKPRGTEGVYRSTEALRHPGAGVRSVARRVCEGVVPAGLAR